MTEASVRPAHTLRPTGVGRQLRMELRKCVDTRNAQVMLGLTVGLPVVFCVLAAVTATQVENDKMFAQLMSVITYFGTLTFPVVGVMAITGEWSTRAAMSTYTLNPRRGQVLAAKIAAVTIISIAVFAWVAILGAITATLMGYPLPPAPELARQLAVGWFGVTGAVWMGLAFGAAFLNSTAAVASYFLIPSLAILLTQWEGVSAIQRYVNVIIMQQQLMSGTMPPVGVVAVNLVLWTLIPLAIGVWRNQVNEVS